MKYRLANSKITENYARALLEERGVEDYIKFLAPSADVVNAPTNLENIDEGARILLETVKKPGHLITLIIDCDVDGFTSSTILWQYLHEICPQVNISYEIHSGKQHGLEDIFEKIEGMKVPPDLVIVPDAGSNDYRYHEGLKAHGITTLVLDHHEADHLSEDAIIINNQLSPNYTNKALTGAGVVWQFCKYIDSILGTTYADKYIDLAALGLVADMASVLTLENRYVIKEGLENVQNFFFKVLVDKQSFSLGNKLTPIGISFYIAPLVNALIRVGSMQEKENLFLAFIDGTQIVNSTKRGEKGLTEKLAIQVARDCTNSRNRQNKIKEKAVEALEVKIAKHDLLDNKILLVRLDDDDDFPAVLNGLVAMQLAAKYKKPTIVARLNDEGYVRGSIRGLNDSELKDFKGFLNESGFFEYCEGHANAAGCSIKNSDLTSFHNYANDSLVDINFNENLYDVNFICHAKDNLKDLIFDLDGIKDTYGQTNNEPLIAVEEIRVDKRKDITIMGKNQDTVKINYNGVAYMFFRAEEFIEALATAPDIFSLTIIGRANLNEYMGSVTPQLMVDSWDIKPYTIFEF